MKKCIKCGGTKSLDCFNNDRRAKDGKYTYCKQCVSKRRSRINSEFHRKGIVVSVESKFCTRCQTQKPSSEFWKDGGMKDGLNASCKVCKYQDVKRYQEKYREKIKSQRLLKTWGIDFDEYKLIYDKQGGQCKICKDSYELIGSKTNASLAYDHCHSTNLFRGLLCHKCNLMLGNARDKIEILESAIKYLEGSIK